MIHPCPDAERHDLMSSCPCGFRNTASSTPTATPHEPVKDWAGWTRCRACRAHWPCRGADIASMWDDWSKANGIASRTADNLDDFLDEARVEIREYMGWRDPTPAPTCSPPADPPPHRRTA